jgi:hypothetical protein
VGLQNITDPWNHYCFAFLSILPLPRPQWAIRPIECLDRSHCLLSAITCQGTHIGPPPLSPLFLSSHTVLSIICSLGSLTPLAFLWTFRSHMPNGTESIESIENLTSTVRRLSYSNAWGVGNRATQSGDGCFQRGIRDRALCQWSHPTFARAWTRRFAYTYSTVSYTHFTIRATSSILAGKNTPADSGDRQGDVEPSRFPSESGHFWIALTLVLSMRSS